jgi:hypothetical protein
MKMNEDGSMVLSEVIAHEDALSPETRRWKPRCVKGVMTGSCKKLS